MSIERYIQWIQQHWATYTATPVTRSSLYLANELAGEAGESANVVKKICRRLMTYSFRDAMHNVTPEERQKLVDEIGDALHCTLHLMEAHDITLDEVMKFNVEKLTRRYEMKQVQ